MCKCNTVIPRRYSVCHLVKLRPDPYQCVRAQCGFLFSSASSPTRSLTFGRWGCGERCHLSHAVGDSAVVLSGMSRQIALHALRSSQTHEAGFKCPSGHGQQQHRAFQEVRRADTPGQGLQVARNRASPLQAHLRGTSTTRLVGGRGPSVLQRWGVWGLPRRFRLRSRRCRNRGGSVVLESGAKTQEVLRRQKSNAG